MCPVRRRHRFIKINFSETHKENVGRQIFKLFIVGCGMAGGFNASMYMSHALRSGHRNPAMTVVTSVILKAAVDLILNSQ